MIVLSKQYREKRNRLENRGGYLFFLDIYVTAEISLQTDKKMDSMAAGRNVCREQKHDRKMKNAVSAIGHYADCGRSIHFM